MGRHDHRSKEAEAYRAWYKTKRWQDVRKAVVIRDLYQCQRCKVIDGRKGALVVHHKKAHKGNPDLFWCDMDGLETLCKHCHDSHEQSLEKGGAGRSLFTEDGRVVWDE